VLTIPDFRFKPEDILSVTGLKMQKKFFLEITGQAKSTYNEYEYELQSFPENNFDDFSCRHGKMQKNQINYYFFLNDKLCFKINENIFLSQLFNNY
jgi:hypothetical protein